MIKTVVRKILILNPVIILEVGRVLIHRRRKIITLPKCFQIQRTIYLIYISYYLTNQFILFFYIPFEKSWYPSNAKYIHTEKLTLQLNHNRKTVHTHLQNAFSNIRLLFWSIFFFFLSCSCPWNYNIFLIFLNRDTHVFACSSFHSTGCVECI